MRLTGMTLERQRIHRLGICWGEKLGVIVEVDVVISCRAPIINLDILQDIR